MVTSRSMAGLSQIGKRLLASISRRISFAGMVGADGLGRIGRPDPLLTSDPCGRCAAARSAEDPQPGEFL